MYWIFAALMTLPEAGVDTSLRIASENSCLEQSSLPGDLLRWSFGLAVAWTDSELDPLQVSALLLLLDEISLCGGLECCSLGFVMALLDSELDPSPWTASALFLRTEESSFLEGLPLDSELNSALFRRFV